MPLDYGQIGGGPKGYTVSRTGSAVSNSANQQGTYYEPWQRDYLQNASSQSLARLQGTPGPGNFDAYQKWGGPEQKFSSVTPSPVYSPELIRQATNSIWGNAQAQIGNQLRDANNLRPGMGSMSPFLAELRAGIQGRGLAGAQQNILNWQQTAAQQNAGNILEGQRLRLGSETAAAQANQNRLALMQGVRAQDVQRENALLNSLGRYIQPLSYGSSYSSSSSPVFG
jgi:hypothetical protein